MGLAEPFRDNCLISIQSQSLVELGSLVAFGFLDRIGLGIFLLLRALHNSRTLGGFLMKLSENYYYINYPFTTFKYF